MRKILNEDAACSGIVTIHPRDKKFHKPVIITIPFPEEVRSNEGSKFRILSRSESMVC